MDEEPRRGTLPETPDLPERSAPAIAIMVVGLILAAIAAGYVTFAEPGFVRAFHNGQARFLGGGYYPQLTFILAFGVFAIPIAGAVSLIDNAVASARKREG